MSGTIKLLSGANVWTPDLRSFSVSRGRASTLDQIDASTCSLALDNRTRQHDPFSGTATIYQPVALSWVIGANTYPLFAGNAESWQTTWNDPDAISTAVCADGLAEFARRALSAMVPASAQTYADVVNDGQPTSYWPCNSPPSLIVKAATGTDLVAANNADLTMGTGNPAMVGDPTLESGYGYITVNAGGQIRVSGITGNASNASDGDPGPSGTMCFEFWLNIASSLTTMAPNPTTIVFGPGDTGGTPKWKLEVDTGRHLLFTARMNGGATAYTTAQSTSLTAGTWYHVLLNVGGNSAAIYLNGVANVSVATTGFFANTLSVGSGSIMQFAAPNVSNISMTQAAFYPQGAVFSALDHYNAGTSGHGSQATGARITSAIADVYAGYPVSTIDAGVRNILPMFASGQTGLEMMRDAVAVDNVDAMLYIQANGNLRYRDANSRSGQAVAATFGDQGGPELPYVFGSGLTMDYSSTDLFNHWAVNKPLGAPQLAQDATSIAAYGRRDQTLEAQFNSDANAATVAAALLAKYKDPLARVLTIQPIIQTDAAAAAVLTLDIGDKIVVKRTPPGGGTRISQTLWIQGIQISGDASKPFLDCTLGVSPL